MTKAMNEKEMRKLLLENVTKMLEWISSEFMKADCDVPYAYMFASGFIYGHSCDHLVFNCSKDASFRFEHYGSSQKVTKEGKMYNGHDEYSQSYINNLCWYIPRENVEGFKKAMSEWTSVKSAVIRHLENMNNLKRFEI